MMAVRTRHARTAAFSVFAVALITGAGASSPRSMPHARATPIDHVVVIYQENHSFDNVLGAFCAATDPPRCDGATSGTLPNGQSIPLAQAKDLIPLVDHTTKGQARAIDGGKMDGFGLNFGCTVDTSYACYSQFHPDQIPNLTALASSFAVSDRTFELSAIPSFGSHLELVTTTLDGFTGDNTVRGTSGQNGRGWGCDSYHDAPWVDPRTHKRIRVPACVPDQMGRGPYRASPVAYVPTLMDRLDQAGVSWRFYVTDGTKGKNSGYNWAICPTFFECLNSPQDGNLLPADRILQDAADGNLPRFSILLPNSATANTSQHNGTSMAAGDNWIGHVMSAIEHGPDWASTAVFITYDDCGCFYDHVSPPAGRGIRVPMVIVSPYAKPGYTDHEVASFASLLAFTEHTFGVTPLGSVDANAYDFSGAFDFAQHPLAAVRMVRTRVSSWERRWVAAHPEVDVT